jgi:hypothetical protein
MELTFDDVKDCLYDLFQVVTGAEAFTSIEDMWDLLNNIGNPQRDYLIKLRDDALDAGNMKWTVVLSHCIATLYEHSKLRVN